MECEQFKGSFILVLYFGVFFAIAVSLSPSGSVAHYKNMSMQYIEIFKL